MPSNAMKIAEQPTGAVATAEAPIEVVLGTKAQYIKTAPVLRELDRQGIPYRLIDTGQHAGLTPELREDLEVQAPEILLSDNGNIATLKDAAVWALKIAWDAAFRPKKVRETYFAQGSEYCLIHGDTPTTLLSLLLAKRAGKKVVHLEAGLRSYNVFKPFPEELIRIICMRFSDVLFTPGASATRNLEKMKVKGRVVELPQNTNVEALYHSLRDMDALAGPDEGYALITVHRVETIFSKQRIRFVLDWARKIAAQRRVIFVMHDPTRKRLEATGMMGELESIPNLEIKPLMSHARFARLLAGSAFIVTDGGSIQEESFFLDVPCLVMRTETERDEGVGGNVRMGAFDHQVMEDFLRDHASLRRGEREPNRQPSRVIVDALAGPEG